MQPWIMKTAFTILLHWSCFIRNINLHRGWITAKPPLRAEMTLSMQRKFFSFKSNYHTFNFTLWPSVTTKSVLDEQPQRTEECHAGMLVVFSQCWRKPPPLNCCIYLNFCWRKALNMINMRKLLYSFKLLKHTQT